jgi:hypothetical protein
VSRASRRVVELLLITIIARQLERPDGMEIINRSAILVKPAQPFLDWLHQVDPTSARLKLDDLRLEPTIYLLPECESKEEAIECLGEVCTEIFEEQLDGWYRVPSAWPAERDLNAFLLLWFEWSLHSMIVDLGDDPIGHEEI